MDSDIEDLELEKMDDVVLGSIASASNQNDDPNRCWTKKPKLPSVKF